MTDLVITPANVAAGAGARVEHSIAGVTITAGQTLYLDSADGKMKLADNDAATAAIRSARGIALNGASNGQPVAYLTKGPITIGATLVAGETYYLSSTAGGICPSADVTTGKYPVILGIAKSTNVLEVAIIEGGVARG